VEVLPGEELPAALRGFTAASLGVGQEGCAQLVGVHAIEVDFVRAAIQAEPHGLCCLAAIQIVFKDAYYSGYQPETLSAMRNESCVAPGVVRAQSNFRCLLRPETFRRNSILEPGKAGGYEKPAHGGRAGFQEEPELDQPEIPNWLGSVLRWSSDSKF
jgi:hypothetical protein